jgi:hypothetical protein
MFYLFLAVYSVGVDVAGVVFYSELFPNHIRAKGVCLSIATIALTDLVYLQATTTAFAIITGLGSVLMYFVLPETKGIPLEEMAKIFGDTDDVVVFSENVHVDHNTHELVIDNEGLSHVATHQGITEEIKQGIVEHREKVTDA